METVESLKDCIKKLIECGNEEELKLILITAHGILGK
jgi:hypothetical protein